MKLKNLGTDAAGQPVYEVCGIKSLRSRSRLPRTRLSANFGNRKPAQKLALPVERNLHFKSTKKLSAYAAEARVQYPGVRRVRF